MENDYIGHEIIVVDLNIKFLGYFVELATY